MFGLNNICACVVQGRRGCSLSSDELQTPVKYAPAQLCKMLQCYAGKLLNPFLSPSYLMRLGGSTENVGEMSVDLVQSVTIIIEETFSEKTWKLEPNTYILCCCRILNFTPRMYIGTVTYGKCSLGPQLHGYVISLADVHSKCLQVLYINISLCFGLHFWLRLSFPESESIVVSVSETCDLYGLILCSRLIRRSLLGSWTL